MSAPVRRRADGAVELVLRVVPGAGREEGVGRHGDAIKVRVTAPPEGGRANRAVLGLLARELGVRPDDLQLVSGAASRTKKVVVAAAVADRAVDRLDELVGTAGAS